MKVWHCWYNWSGGYGAFQDYNCIVIAEIKDKAIGMALMNYTDTHAEGWEAEEIPTDRDLVFHISERCG